MTEGCTLFDPRQGCHYRAHNFLINTHMHGNNQAEKVICSAYMLCPFRCMRRGWFSGWRREGCITGCGAWEGRVNESTTRSSKHTNSMHACGAIHANVESVLCPIFFASKIYWPLKIAFLFKCSFSSSGARCVDSGEGNECVIAVGFYARIWNQWYGFYTLFGNLIVMFDGEVMTL
jgi:hypothetical protein